MTSEDAKKPPEILAAELDPAAAFSTPEQVRDHPTLSIDEKIEILRRWAYDDADMAVALEEGMPEGRGHDLEHRVLTILASLSNSLDLERTGPSKQHGISTAPADAVGRKRKHD